MIHLSLFFRIVLHSLLFIWGSYLSARFFIWFSSNNKFGSTLHEIYELLKQFLRRMQSTRLQLFITMSNLKCSDDLAHVFTLQYIDLKCQETRGRTCEWWRLEEPWSWSSERMAADECLSGGAGAPEGSLIALHASGHSLALGTILSDPPPSDLSTFLKQIPLF